MRFAGEMLGEKSDMVGVVGAGFMGASIAYVTAAAGIPAPAFSSSLAYYDGLRADRLPAALIQGQRDFFGAHTYKRVDMEGTFHTTWSGEREELSY